jgi:sugar lactone lactonase YvrE
LQAALVLTLGFGAAARAEDYSLTTFAGATTVITGADGTPGSFNGPYGIAIDAQKNLYVTDTLNNTIRKISPARVVSTLAGAVGQAGSANGAGSAARFNFPVGIGVDGAGNVYVSEVTNSVIRKITPAGDVTTFAGAVLQFGAVDGAAATARFTLPRGLAVDGAGNIFVADGGNHTIRRITPEGTVSTLAGAAGQPGTTNGSGSAARFNGPFGIAVDGSGNVFVADSESHTIRRVTAAGVVTTVAGQPGVSGSTDGATAVARFNQPRGVAVDAAGNIFVADYGNSTIRHIATNGTVTTIAGAAGIQGDVDSVGASARLYSPTGIVADGTTIYVADTMNNLVRRGQPASAAALPTIGVQPLDQEVAVGQSVTLSVVASGTGLTYQWLRNTVAIAGATGSSYTLNSPQVADTGSYSARVSGVGGAVTSATGNVSVVPVAAGGIAITARPLSQAVAAGERVVLSVAAQGSGLTYQWLRDGATLTGATTPSYTIASAQTGDAGTYAVRIASGTTTVTPTAKLLVGGSSGTGATVRITTQPTAGAVTVGRSITLTVVAAGTNLAYQWFKDGAQIAGATSASFAIASVQTANAGAYFVRVSSGAISADSNPATLTVITEEPPPPPPPSGARLSNLSVRTALPANERLIVGMTMSGGAGNVLVRAVGPTLGAFGVGTAMADPRLELYSGQTRVLENDNWSADLAATFGTVGAFGLTAGSRDAAFVRSIDGGVTAQALGPAAGVVLVEAYALGTGGNGKLVNLSARNQVGTGENILIAGFTVTGSGQKRLLIRAVGPGLGAFGLTGFLVDPRVEVYSGATRIAENDNWSGDLAAAAASVGAFALTAGSRDAALITTLAEGSYTVQVSGVAGGTGEALVEVYELP